MSTSQQVGRGSHRLGLFVAAFPLLVGAYLLVTQPSYTVPANPSWVVLPSDRAADIVKVIVVGIGEEEIRVIGATFNTMTEADREKLALAYIDDHWRNYVWERVWQTAWLAFLAVAVAGVFYGIVRGAGWVLQGFTP